VALALAYVLSFGGLWNGIIHPGMFGLSRGFLAVLFAAWAWWRTAHCWRLPSVGVPWLLWGVAWLLSTLAHPALEPLVPLWFSVLGLMLWWMLRDMLLNRALSTEILVDGLLLVGLLLMARVGLDLVTHQTRISAGLENPNYAGTVLAMLLPLALRRRWWIYAALCAACLAATMSRGPVLALAGAGVIAGALALRTHVHVGRAILVGALLALPMAVIVVGRSSMGLTGREVYWADALQRFAANPLTGEGAFTYRHVDFADASRIHWHPHSLPLTVAAEMGLPGLLALGLTVWAIARRAWQRRDAGLIAALTTGALCQLWDFSAQQPAVALVLLIVAVAASTVERVGVPYVRSSSAS
jgi:O-antigen ligase